MIKADKATGAGYDGELVQLGQEMAMLFRAFKMGGGTKFVKYMLKAAELGLMSDEQLMDINRQADEYFKKMFEKSDGDADE